jgi:hypothetical protein
MLVANRASIEVIDVLERRRDTPDNNRNLLKIKSLLFNFSPPSWSLLNIFIALIIMYGNVIFFLQIQDQTRLAHSQWLPPPFPAPAPRPSINLVSLQNRPKYIFFY